jgi:hypothetical protein
VLGAGGDHHLVRVGGQAGGAVAPGDQLAQRGQALEVVAGVVVVVLGDVAADRPGGPMQEGRGRRRGGDGEVDHRLALGGRRPGHHPVGLPVRGGHLDEAARTPLAAQVPRLAQQPVRRAHRVAADPQLRREQALGRQPAAGREAPVHDQNLQRLGEGYVGGSLALPPAEHPMNRRSRDGVAHKCPIGS